LTTEYLGNDPAAGVFLLSAMTTPRERALALGAAAYLAKTMPPDELLAALRALFD
jgi:DNA-binding response OmpR family regulator